MLDPYIRAMRLEDIDDVHAIECEIGIDPWEKTLFIDCLRVGYDCVVAIDKQGQVLAFSMMSIAANEAHLLNIGVSKQFQGHGVGKKLLLHMIATARNKAANVMFLEVRITNSIAHNLYNSLNFQEIGLRKNYYNTTSGKEDAITYALDLTIN